MEPAFDAVEKVDAFWEEHFILGISEQRALNKEKTGTAAARQHAKVLGPALVELRQMLLKF